MTWFSASRSTIAATLAALAALVLAPAAAGSAGSWPQYGYSARHTFANLSESAITTATVSQLAAGWSHTVAAGAYLANTPTVANGRVFVVAQGGPMVAFDAASGAVLWTTGTGAAGQAAVARGHVFVCLNGIVQALDPRAGTPLFTAGACTGSPAVDGRLGFTAGGVVHAWSTATGRPLWRSQRRINLLDQVPTVGYGKVYAEGAYPRDEHNVYAFDEATGRLVNVRHAGGGCAPGAPPFLCGWYIMAGSSIAGGNLWTVQFQWCAECADIDGEALPRAFSIARGAPTEPSFEDITNYWDPTTPPPVVGYGHVYVPSLEHEAAYPIAPGARQWASTATSTMNLTLAGGVAYFADCGCALSASTGRLLWSSGRQYAAAAPAIAGGVVYWPQGDELRTYRLPG